MIISSLRVASRFVPLTAVLGVCLMASALQPADAKTQRTSCQQETILVQTDRPEVHKSWRVKRNEVCAGKIDVALRKSSGVWPDGYINNFHIMKQASHGFVGVTNSDAYGGFAYQPASDFVGPDSFEVSVDHHLPATESDADESQKVHITIDVEVAD